MCYFQCSQVKSEYRCSSKYSWVSVVEKTWITNRKTTLTCASYGRHVSWCDVMRRSNRWKALLSMASDLTFHEVASAYKRLGKNLQFWWLKKRFTEIRNECPPTLHQFYCMTADNELNKLRIFLRKPYVSLYEWLVVDKMEQVTRFFLQEWHLLGRIAHFKSRVIGHLSTEHKRTRYVALAMRSCIRACIIPKKKWTVCGQNAFLDHLLVWSSEHPD